MSQIRGKNTKPEMLVRKFLHSKGLRYKLHDKTLPGKPDLVFPRYKVVVNINGCFWHGHDGCKYYVIPKTRTDWWVNKLNKNVQKDEENIMKLHYLGWNVIVVWECELKKDQLSETLNNLYEKIICLN